MRHVAISRRTIPLYYTQSRCKRQNLGLLSLTSINNQPKQIAHAAHSPHQKYSSPVNHRPCPLHSRWPLDIFCTIGLLLHFQIMHKV